MRTLFRILIKITGAIPAYLLLKLKCHGKKIRIPPKKTAIIICSHNNVLDVMMIIALYPFKSIRFLAGELMYGKNKFFDFLLKNIGCIRVDRNNFSDASYLGEVTRAARNGEIICIFPEAHFDHGEILPFQNGAAFLSSYLNIPVIPIYTDSCYGLFKRTTVVFGSLFSPPANDQSLTEVSSEYRREILKCKNLLQKEKAEKDFSHRESFWNRLLYRLTQFGISIWFSIAYRPKIIYENPSLIKRTLPHPSIVICNHVHMFDPAMLCKVFYTSRLHVLAAGEIFDTNPFVSFTLRVCNAIRLNRTGAIDTQSYRECMQVIRNGETLGIFPEGHIHADGELGDFMPGYLMFAVSNNVPIIPVCFSHTYSNFGKRLKILVGSPVVLQKDDKTPSSEWMSRENDNLRNIILSMKKRLNETDLDS